MYAEDELNNNPVAHTVTVTSKSRHDQPTRVFVQYAIFSTISVVFIVRIRVIFEYRANESLKIRIKFKFNAALVVGMRQFAFGKRLLPTRQP